MGKEKQLLPMKKRIVSNSKESSVGFGIKDRVFSEFFHKGPTSALGSTLY